MNIEPSLHQIKNMKDVLDRLQQILAPSGVTFQVGRGINLADSVCSPDDSRCLFMLTKGRVSFFHESNGLLVGSINAPFLIGLAYTLSPEIDTRFFTDSDCEGFWVPASTAIQVIEEHDAWRDVAYVMTFVIQRLAVRDTYFSGADAYRTIRYLLRKLNNESEEFKNSVSAIKYLTQRSHLSRSLVSRILGQLRLGGYIVMSGKHLLYINKLPQNY